MIFGRAVSRATLLAVSILGLVVSGACSSSNTVARSPDGASADAAPTSDDGAIAAGEAGLDASPSACEGACKTMTLVADFGGKKRPLVRAQFGTQAGDAGTELHIEAHAGGNAACPTASSPTPDYTLVLSGVPRGGAGRKLSDRDGLTTGFFDFKGDLGLPPVTKSISVNVTVVAEDPASPPAWVALELTTGFREGSVAGHVYAEYCASLSQ